MSQVAFYAPLKSPDHANPSGDRQIARALMQALEFSGYSPALVSELRTLDGKGDPDQQAALIAKAWGEIPDLIAKGRRAGWTHWVTYHNYYKAPDLLGPAVADALNIPYVQIESTRARKRLTGPWARFAQIAEDAAHAADVIFYFTERDAIALKNYAPDGQHLIHLRPFLNIVDLPPKRSGTGSLFAAGMMRPGDKFDSYRLIAKTLMRTETPWTLDIAGDGTARTEVEALMAPFGDKVRFLGQLDRDAMARAYHAAQVFFWPGVNEAIGMVYLEAQAAGLPVLAQNRPGMRDVLAPHLSYPDPETGSSGLVGQLEALLQSPPDPDPIRAYIVANHLLSAAAHCLKTGLSGLGPTPT